MHSKSKPNEYDTDRPGNSGRDSRQHRGHGRQVLHRGGDRRRQSGRYETEGYSEDDRLSGTGAWITTAVRVTVDECRVYEAREDGDWTESRLRPDTSAIERYAERLAA